MIRIVIACLCFEIARLLDDVWCLAPAAVILAIRGEPVLAACLVMSSNAVGHADALDRSPEVEESLRAEHARRFRRRMLVSVAAVAFGLGIWAGGAP